MDAAANGVAEEQDDEHGIDQQDVLYRMVLFLATVTVRLFSRVLGADNAPFRSVVSKRGEYLAIHQFSRAAQRGGSGRQDRTILTMRRRPLVNQEGWLRGPFLGLSATVFFSWGG